MNDLTKLHAFCFDTGDDLHSVIEFTVSHRNGLFVPTFQRLHRLNYIGERVVLASPFFSLERSLLKILEELRRIETEFGLYPRLVSTKNLLPYERRANELASFLKTTGYKHVTIFGSRNKFPSIGSEAFEKMKAEVLRAHGLLTKGLTEVDFETLLQEEHDLLGRE